ncbi:MAG: hypothetical protein HQL82_10875, partial [Magnetococcales bacterium]|nr:hypothetical protein [Magnetococcales bacterium]
MVGFNPIVTRLSLFAISIFLADFFIMLFIGNPGETWGDISRRAVVDAGAQVAVLLPLAYLLFVRYFQRRQTALGQANRFVSDTFRQTTDIIDLATGNEDLKVQLERILASLFALPWLSIEKKGSIFLRIAGQDALEMVVQSGLHNELLDKCRTVPFGKCLCGRAAAEQRIQFADCLDKRHDIIFDDIKPHGHYCVPIVVGG